MSVSGAVETSGTSLHLGLDLGGTNLKWAVVERSGEEWRRRESGQVATVSGGPDTIVPQLMEVAASAAAVVGGVASIGIGVPGLYKPADGTVVFLVNIPGAWAGRPVAGPVSAATGIPTFLINDARAFGLAELRLGAGRGAECMVGLTLGTGIGGVIAVGGQIHQGYDGTAGELGHQTIDPDGPWCNCGNRGCVEAFARADQIAHACGTPTVEEAVRAASAGDERALRGFADVGRYLGIGIANMITVLTPDRIVIGGGVSGAGDLLLEPIRAEIRRRVHTTVADRADVVIAALGTWAGSIGAAVHGAERARETASQGLSGSLPAGTPPVSGSSSGTP